MTLGELVKQERKKAGLTQQALADQAQVSKMTIRRIESIATNDDIKSVKLETLIAVSGVLKSYAIWSMSVGGYGLTENDPDVGPVFLSAAALQKEYGFTSKQISRKNMMDYAYAELNDEGQQKVYDYTIDLSGNPKYTAESDPDEPSDT